MKQRVSRRRRQPIAACLIACGVFSVASAQPQQPQQGAAAVDVTKFAEVVARHPAADVLRRLFSNQPSAPRLPQDFKPTGLTKKDYLSLMAGNVDFWKHHQNAEGAIIDPVEKKERQYSTPTFACAAAMLVREAGRDDLLDPATRAFTFSLDALVNKTTADNHADFYIPALIHAHRILKTRVPEETLAGWDAKLRQLVPEKTYRHVKGAGNWNIVNVSGELMRVKDGLIDPALREAHAAYVERCLADQESEYTRFGMYRDPNGPLAYDAFPRLWYEDMLADRAYDGLHAPRLREFLKLGGLSSLLLISPSGEWASGGRSAHHQWNEAENAVICEINAAWWNKHGRPGVAGSFKRAARMCLASMKRWQRPSGEMWIVKNFADPARRFGYEGYSFHSQYNLLPMAMLAIAYERADESIEERPIPSESATYVFDVRETFRKVVAASGGTYVLIDTAADPHYDATGLQRVHRAGVALSPLSDSVAARRGYGPADETAAAGLTPGIQWRETPAGPWRSLADFVSATDGAGKQKPTDVAKAADLQVGGPGPAQTEYTTFTLRYDLAGSGARPVEETYTLSSLGVDGTAKVLGSTPPAATRVALPVLVFDGVRATKVTVDGPKVRCQRVGGTMTWEVTSPAGVTLSLAEPKLVNHNGYAQAAVADLPAGTREVRWKLTLEPDQQQQQQQQQPAGK